MTKLTFIQKDGTRQTVDGQTGMTVMETAVKNMVPGIDADCGGACACATCHVYVEPGWLEQDRPAQRRWKRTCSTSPSTCARTSRLSCQIKITDALDGLHGEGPRKAVLRLQDLRCLRWP